MVATSAGSFHEPERKPFVLTDYGGTDDSHKTCEKSDADTLPAKHCGKRLRVAVADDEPLILDFLAETVSTLGYDVVVLARNGIELLDGCARAAPDLIVTDINMPFRDGIHAVMEICRNRPLPVVFITGFSERSKVSANAHGCGVFVYLVKPVGTSKLMSGIEIVLDRYSQFSAIQAEESDIEQAMQAWLMLEEAKGVLMEKRKMEEVAAFNFILSKASEEGQRLREVAEWVLRNRPT